jgi:hypothetical protein
METYEKRGNPLTNVLSKPTSALATMVNGMPIL